MSRNFHSDYMAVEGNLNSLETSLANFAKKRPPGQLKMIYHQKLNAPYTRNES